MISRDYQKRAVTKDISQGLFINPVYLGQLIKRETNATFAELPQQTVDQGCPAAPLIDQ